MTRVTAKALGEILPLIFISSFFPKYFLISTFNVEYLYKEIPPKRGLVLHLVRPSITFRGSGEHEEGNAMSGARPYVMFKMERSKKFQTVQASHAFSLKNFFKMIALPFQIGAHRFFGK
jgi:hypothetical protein